MRNLEFKARCADWSRAEQSAQALGAVYDADLHQLDTYFVTPSGRLKLREINRTAGELIVYHRPEDAATRWSDYFTAPVTDAPALRTVLTKALGVRHVIEKQRRVYLYQGARIHLDRVRSLGTFIEFEVPTRDDAARAHALMVTLLAAFGLTEADALTLSYGEMDS